MIHPVFTANRFGTRNMKRAIDRNLNSCAQNCFRLPLLARVASRLRDALHRCYGQGWSGRAEAMMSEPPWLVATNDEGLMWEFKFLRSENDTATINGDIMTLVADMAVHDDVEPKVDIRLFVPLDLEAQMTRPIVDLHSPLVELLNDVEQLKEPFRNEAICERVRAALRLYEGGTPEMPFPVRKALEHVRVFHPEVDRVVFWADGRWAYMTDGHEVPKFDKRVDTGVLEDAGNAVGNLSPCAPIAFQLPDEP